MIHTVPWEVKMVGAKVMKPALSPQAATRGVGGRMPDGKVCEKSVDSLDCFVR